MPEPATAVVVDASAIIDLLVDSELAPGIAERLRNRPLVAPAHLDVEVASALGRLERSGQLNGDIARTHLVRVADAPIERQPVAPLLEGAWARRHDTRLTDALYIELATALDTVVITTDRRLARTHGTRTDVPGSGQP